MLTQTLMDKAIRAALCLSGSAKDLLARLRGARDTGLTSYLPSRFRKDPATSERRIARALEWAEALTETLIGSALYLLPATPRRKPAIPLQPPGRPASAEVTDTSPIAEYRRLLARRRTIRRTFATQPTNIVAQRIARRLGHTPDADAWPIDIAEITQTPAQWAHAVRAGIPRRVLTAWRQSEAEIAQQRRSAALKPRSPTPPPPSLGAAAAPLHPP